MTKHRIFRARPLRALAAALAIVAASLAAAAPQASAGLMECNYEVGTYNACLSTEAFHFGWFDARVGIDVYLPEQWGREIVACGARFKASLRGDDGKGTNDQVIRQLSLVPGWPVASSAGIAAEFIGPDLQGSDLDEDKGSDTDEPYARISYYDCHTGLTREFVSGVLKGRWG